MLEGADAARPGLCSVVSVVVVANFFLFRRGDGIAAGTDLLGEDRTVL